MREKTVYVCPLCETDVFWLADQPAASCPNCRRWWDDPPTKEKLEKVKGMVTWEPAFAPGPEVRAERCFCEQPNQIQWLQCLEANGVLQHHWGRETHSGWVLYNIGEYCRRCGALFGRGRTYRNWAANDSYSLEEQVAALEAEVEALTGGREDVRAAVRATVAGGEQK